ncbi:hypothetical protein MRX96_011629 [Rhipicephalus microplus]
MWKREDKQRERFVADRNKLPNVLTAARRPRDISFSCRRQWNVTTSNDARSRPRDEEIGPVLGELSSGNKRNGITTKRTAATSKSRNHFSTQPGPRGRKRMRIVEARELTWTLSVSCGFSPAGHAALAAGSATASRDQRGGINMRRRPPGARLSAQPGHIRRSLPGSSLGFVD